jgi:hypothetical protein
MVSRTKEPRKLLCFFEADDIGRAVAVHVGQFTPVEIAAYPATGTGAKAGILNELGEDEGPENSPDGSGCDELDLTFMP